MDRLGFEPSHKMDFLYSHYIARFLSFGILLIDRDGNVMGKVVSLQQNGDDGRYNITIPKAMVETKGWEKGDDFEIEEIASNELRVTRK